MGLGVVVLLGPAMSGASIAAASRSWQTLGEIGGVYRLDLDRSGTMPQGQARVRVVVEQNGHTAGSGFTVEYDCAKRALRSLTRGDWVDDHIANEKPAAKNEWSSTDDSSKIVLNALCGVTIDTGRALGTTEGWKPLGTFEGRELQILPASRTVDRAQYRLGTSRGGFSGVGWLFELDCEGHGMRSLRDQDWKGGAMTSDKAAMVNTWTSTERDDLGRAIYGGVCPRR